MRLVKGRSAPALARETGIRAPQVPGLSKMAKMLNVLIVIPPNERKFSCYGNILGLRQTDFGRLAGLPTSIFSPVERGELVTLSDSVVA